MDCFGACQGVLGVSCGLLIGGRVWWVSPLLWKVKTVSGAAAVRIVVEESNKTETHTITPIISQSHDPTPARRSGGGRRRRHAVDGRPPSASRGGVGVHCRVPPGQDPGRPRQTFPLARERVHRRATDRHDHPSDKTTRAHITQRAEPVWNPIRYSHSWRAGWHYSHKRALHDRRTLTAQENKAQAVVAGEKTARNPRFVPTTLANSKPPPASASND